MKESILRINDAIYLTCIWVSGIAIFAMSLIIPWGIFTRYVLGSGSQWPEPIAILLMVVFSFIGAAASYRAGAHIAVAMLTSRLSGVQQTVLRYVIHVLMGCVAAFMAWYGTKLCMQTWGQSIPELTWMPVGFTYMPVPVSGLITLIFVIEHIVFGSQAHRAVVIYDHESAPAQEPEAA